MFKWLVTIVAVIALLLLGFYVYGTKVGNPKVVQEIKENPEGTRAGIVMMLTFPDGKVLPVNYLREGNQVFAGADGRWWRDFKAGGVPVTVEIRGESMTGKARVVLDDPAYTQDVFKRLRPNVPKWLPQWLDAYLVVIDLDT